MKKTNILKSIINIANLKDIVVPQNIKSTTTINKMGDSLEYFVKNAFAGTFNTKEEDNLLLFNDLFSWQGGANNPPDLILRNSVAIEVKKIEGYGAIALNSSFPKCTVKSIDPMITLDCKKCELGNWTKSLYYYIGTVTKEKKLKSIFIVEGKCYAAEENVYLKMKNIIKDGTNSISGVSFSETKEFGKVKKVDPLGITDLRIRGMWSIQNPYDAFNYLSDIQKPKKEESVLYALISEDTYNSYDQRDKEAINTSNNITISKINIKSPNNPVKLIKSKLIKAELS